MASKFFNYKNKGTKDLARDGYRKIRMAFINTAWAPLMKRWYGFHYNSVADPNKTIVIKIDDIKGFMWGFKYTGLSFRGHVQAGNWDQKYGSVDELRRKDKFVGIWQRYREGMDWMDTALFTKYKSMLKKNRHVMEKGNIHSVKEYYENKIDTLYREIRDNGFLAPSEKNPQILPVYVHIGRNGEFIYTGEGNHRLAIAYCLNLRKIPVCVWKRHKLWQLKREILLNTPRATLPESLKKYITHPDIISEPIGNTGFPSNKKINKEEPVFH